ncbi:MAG: hypothetical protein JG718_05680 [Candidatus Thiothrix moscowensis]|nr:hypothetical protein [Candidatus Thiothrix moscowensis]
MSVTKPSEDTLENILMIPGVTGFTLTNELGELLHSTIDVMDMNEFIAFLAGMIPAISDAAQLGSIQRAILKSPQTGNLLVVSGDDLSLGVTTGSRSRMQEINGQINTILHWN